MNPLIKERWVEALESGEFQQCSGSLKKATNSDEYSYCCLGVLSELAIADGAVPGLAWGKPAGHHEELVENNDTRNEQNSGMPTPGVYEWAGLSGEDASFLADCNDDNEMSFTQIAHVIRRFL